ncbi:hypothetical protein Taro_006025 [Colocasia esculenta]|uniref:Uncharacterized protein n=1 Tax=Colocasia esculenta TaxID=4460 RepID=A0A843TU33_COLES|nr:hypothetical protein [Colocasia esculenta]
MSEQGAVEVAGEAVAWGGATDCTPAYIALVRARYGGRWVCGLCGEAVEDEIRRGLIGAEEAIRRHAAFRRSFRSSPPPAASGAGEHLIAAVLQLLRRGLESPRGPPAGRPMKKPAGMGAAPGPSVALPGAC